MVCNHAGAAAMIGRTLLVACCSIAWLSTQADGPGAAKEPAAFSLASLAARADLVAVVQVKDTDYVYTRDFPSEGSAYLKVLIPYKPADSKEDIIEVYEKGLHPHECYFENPTVFEEGRRYLGFFRRNPEDRDSYRGLAEGCALEILVTADNRYALKLPLEGFELDDSLAAYAGQVDYHDSYAVVNEDAITPVKREELLASGLIIPYQGGYKYTQGIDLTTARKLLTFE